MAATASSYMAAGYGFFAESDDLYAWTRSMEQCIIILTSEYGGNDSSLRRTQYVSFESPFSQETASFNNEPFKGIGFAIDLI